MILTLHEFEIFDPKYTLEKNGLGPDGEDNWQYIVKDVEYLFEYGCGLIKSGNSWRDKKDFKERINWKF